MKKFLPLFTALAVVALSFATVFSFVSASEISASLTSFNSTKAEYTSCINPKFKIANTGNDNIELGDVRIRYYFNSDSCPVQLFNCDHAAITGAAGYKAINGLVEGRFVNIAGADTADKYLEISFAESAGVVPANSFVEIQARIYNSDWKSCNQSNDYSYNSEANNYTEWENTTLYIGGKLISGVPVGRDGVLASSEVLLSNVEYILKSEDNLFVPFKFNNNKVLSVKNNNASLAMDSYDVSEAGIFLKADYLNTLNDGVYTIRVLFDYGNDCVLNLKVIDPDKPIVYDPLIYASADVNDVDVNVNVLIDHISDEINNFDMTIKFDSTKLKATSVDAGSVVTDVTGFDYLIDNENGTIKVLFIDMSQSEINAIKENGSLFNIRFENIASGNTEVSICDLCICNNNLEAIKTDVSNVAITLS